ncbi:MAG: RNA methyltransferase [bacterium]|nr:RNA methyltransferase [bacterium]
MNRKLKLWELERPSEETFKAQEKFPVTVVLDSLRSLTNVGSFFRTCDAFNVEKLYLCGITAAPPHREIQKTALGATESMNWEHQEEVISLLQSLQKEGKKICSIEQTEETTFLQDVANFPTDEHHVLVFGNEVDGVDQRIVDMSDYIIEVPQFGTKHSLNVSVCAGVVLWEFAKRQLDN